MPVRNRPSSFPGLAGLALASLLAGPTSAAAGPPAERGACCVDDNCRVTTAERCEADGGLYLGDGTKCGQVDCSCEEALTECQVFPGDGAGSGPDLSYTDNGDGTVTDDNTGLMWEVKVAGSGSCLIDLHAVRASCNWNDATGAWIDELNAEGGTGYAGYSDWRLPNLRELQSILDLSRYGPAIDPVFGPTSSNYWSATSYAYNPSTAWNVLFGTGHVNNFSKTLNYRVRAVRGGP